MPHYVLPVYPAIAILIAAAMERGALSTHSWVQRATVLWLIVPLLAGTAAIAALALLAPRVGWPIWPCAAAAAILGLLAWRSYRENGAEAALLLALTAAILAAVVMHAITLPALTHLFPSVQLAHVLRGADCRDPTAAAAGFHEPSLAFLAGTSTILTDGVGAAEFLARGGCRFAFVEARAQQAFKDRAQAVGLRYVMGPTVEGFNYSNGRSVAISVYRAEAQP